MSILYILRTRWTIAGFILVVSPTPHSSPTRGEEVKFYAAVDAFGFSAFIGVGSFGTSSSCPDTLTIALNLSGQTSRQVPHLTHFSWSMTCTILLAPAMASTGQLRARIPRARPLSG